MKKKNPSDTSYHSYPLGIIFTIIKSLKHDGTLTKGHFDDLVVLMKKVAGTVLLDFDADACQSPSRAYLLDVTLPGT